MPDWIIIWLGQLQAGAMRTLAAEMRSGGLGTAGFAFALGALHALTPGHGKAALAAYFLGREAHLGKGVRIALSAALLHVMSGLGTFIVLRLVLKQMAVMTGRPSLSFTALGYGLIIVAGLIMVVQSLRPGGVAQNDNHGHALVAGMGVLPCPLTISVLGFAWTQSSAVMVSLVLLSLALGISFTIGIVAVVAIAARRSLQPILFRRLADLEYWGRVSQGIAGVIMVLIGLYTLARFVV